MKRIVFTAFFLFLLAGGLGVGFNILLKGDYPMIQFVSCGIFAVILYVLETVMLSLTKSELNTFFKIVLNAVTAICTFFGMEFVTSVLVKKLPIWWMHVAWLLFAVFMSWKTYQDSKKIEI